jgi:hypothetical protein
VKPNNGDNIKDRENSRPADESDRKNEKRRSAQKVGPSRTGIALTGLGVRVDILEKGTRETKCRRQQDGKEITVATAELIFLSPSDPEADSPRELFQHSGIRWHDPAENP